MSSGNGDREKKRLRVVTWDQLGDDIPAYASDDKGSPQLRGSAPTGADWECGSCGDILATKVPPNFRPQFVLTCPVCNALNVPPGLDLPG